MFPRTDSQLEDRRIDIKLICSALKFTTTVLANTDISSDRFSPHQYFHRPNDRSSPSKPSVMSTVPFDMDAASSSTSVTTKTINIPAVAIGASLGAVIIGLCVLLLVQRSYYHKKLSRSMRGPMSTAWDARGPQSTDKLSLASTQYDSAGA